MSPRLLPIVPILFLAACAGTGGWKNPNLPPGQESIDESACRHEAEEDMGPQAYSSPGSEKNDTPMQMVDRSELRHQFVSLVDDCMERKGYRPAK
jgi:hypothetical protein